MRRNTGAINNVLKKKNYKTKFSISFVLKKNQKYNFKKQRNKIEKLCGKTSQQSTVFSRKKLQSKNFNQVNI
jgi:hypothetical protein